jgi:hypothetical protein
MRGDKSFADDLIVHRGVVSGRVALLLRSAETNPSMPRFVPFWNLLPLCVQASARAAAAEVEHSSPLRDEVTSWGDIQVIFTGSKSG